MFSLGDGTKFWLYSKPTDMRKNFNMLSGIVNNCMQQNLYSGDVFVFVNASNNMLKLLRYEPGVLCGVFGASCATQNQRTSITGLG